MKYINTYKKKILLCLLFLFFINIHSVFADVSKDKEPTQSEQRVSRAVTNLEGKTLQQLVVDTAALAGKYVLWILLALTVLVFLYGLMKFMFKGQESEAARSEGRKVMLWGIIGLFVITSIWGLVAIAASLVGHSSIVLPQFK